MKVQCPRCKHKWDRKGKNNMVHCPNCDKKFKLKTDDFMRGSISKALQEANKDPLRNVFLRDAVPMLLEEDDIKFSFAQACVKEKKKPEVLMKWIVKDWLMKEGYIK